VQARRQDLPPRSRPTKSSTWCRAASRYSARASLPIRWRGSYSGVRPLYDDARKTLQRSRADYVLLLDEQGPPLLSVFAARSPLPQLAEHVMGSSALDSAQPAWTHAEALPAADFRRPDFPTCWASSARAIQDSIRTGWARCCAATARWPGRSRQRENRGRAGRKTSAGGLRARTRLSRRARMGRTGEDVLWAAAPKMRPHMNEAQRRRVAERMAGGESRSPRCRPRS